MSAGRLLGLMLVAASLCAPVAAGAAEINVIVRNFEFVPNDITAQVGDTVIFTNQSGTHNVVADDGSFGTQPSSANWTFSRVFDQAGVVLVHCSVHSSAGADINTAMNARITISEATPAFTINQGISGAWFNPATSGQGFLVDIDPAAQFIFAAWFTYDADAAGQLLWLSLQGNYTGGQAQIPIFRTSGGAFDSSSTATTASVGNATISFTSCTAGQIDYAFDSPVRTGSIPISRLVAGTEALCEQLSTTTPTSTP